MMGLGVGGDGGWGGGGGGCAFEYLSHPKLIVVLMIPLLFDSYIVCDVGTLFPS